jgi:serine/threonine protein kinase
MLNDFGISRVAMTAGATRSAAATGTANWTAPELLTTKDDMPTFASDMWSFGCTCYEVRCIPIKSCDPDPDSITWKVMTGKTPFQRHNKVHGQLIGVFVRTKGRYTPLKADPEKGQDEHEGAYQVWRVAEQCWYPKPKRRPTAEEVQQALTALGVKGDRPSSEADSASFSHAKRARQNMVEIDYNRVYSILQQVSMQCHKMHVLTDC